MTGLYIRSLTSEFLKTNLHPGNYSNEFSNFLIKDTMVTFGLLGDKLLFLSGEDVRSIENLLFFENGDFDITSFRSAYFTLKDLGSAFESGKR